jgi:hypothetical protein
MDISFLGREFRSSADPVPKTLRTLSCRGGHCLFPILGRPLCSLSSADSILPNVASGAMGVAPPGVFADASLTCVNRLSVECGIGRE